MIFDIIAAGRHDHQDCLHLAALVMSQGSFIDPQQLTIIQFEIYVVSERRYKKGEMGVSLMILMVGVLYVL